MNLNRTRSILSSMHIRQTNNYSKLRTGGHNKPVVISGASIKEKDVYSAEAARAIHEKPMPTHNHATSGNQHAHIPNVTNLQQPRRN